MVQTNTKERTEEQGAPQNIKSDEYLIHAEKVTKRFCNGKVKALSDVDFYVKPNEIVGMLGDNGAGKSTLVKILNGFHTLEEGQLYFEGKKVYFNSPKDAREAGIETAYQNLALVNLMSISRNFFLGRELIKKVLGFPILDKKLMDQIAAKSLGEVGLENIRAMHEAVNFLSGGERQAIAISRSTYFGARLLILDEPTAALSVKETEWVLRLVHAAKENGLSVILISHNAYEAYEVAERFVVLQHGENYANVNREDTNPKELIEIIAGRK